MNYFTRFKPLIFAIIIVALLSGCSTNNEIGSTASTDTQINENSSASTSDQALFSTQSKDTQNTQSATSTTQSEDTQQASIPSLFSGISDYTIDNPKTYTMTEEPSKFSVQYPSAWEVSTSSHANGTPDGSLDAGIFIFFNSRNKLVTDSKKNIITDKNEYIYVYGCMSHGHFTGMWGLPNKTIGGVTGETFTTTEGVKGELLYEKRDGAITIDLSLDEECYGATLHMSEASFENYKAQILGILKSIKLIK